MKNVNVTLIVNRRRAIDWLPRIYSEPPPSDQNYFRSDFENVKIVNDLNFMVVAKMICTVYDILHMLAFNL
jgi:hypothetical protein